jgi:signal transduction histidine kinase
MLMEKEETRIQELTAALDSERRARKQSEVELERTLHNQQEFISLVAHELRIPMTAIQGYTDLLIKAIMGPVNETQLSFLQTIRANIERMSRLVSDLYDINKISSNRMVMKPESVNFKKQVEIVIQDFKTMIAEKQLHLCLDIPESLPALWCDPERLQQVLANLLRNAIQYTPDKGDIHIVAATKLDNLEQVQLQISDTGIGIPSDQQQHVFERFFRADDNETRQTSGNGLALHLSKLLVVLQDGTIDFHSKRGQGSTFTITLPAVKT